jgi:hypothetical protein
MTPGGTTATKRALSPARQRFVELMQENPYGRIRAFEVHGGEPVFTPATTIEEEVVLEKADLPNISRPATDYTLKKEVVLLFRYFDRKQNFSIKKLEIQDGLPRRMTVSRSPKAV